MFKDDPTIVVEKLSLKKIFQLKNTEGMVLRRIPILQILNKSLRAIITQIIQLLSGGW